MPTQDTVKLTIRLEPDLHAWLTAVAKRDRRTINSQISYLLDEARRNDPGPKQPDSSEPLQSQ
jgi:hypothetical protein